jgi:GAF domain-containing protein
MIDSLLPWALASLVLVAGALLVARLARSLRERERRASHEADRTRLLVDGARELDECDAQDDVLVALPSLVRRVLHVPVAAILRPDGSAEGALVALGGAGTRFASGSPYASAARAQGPRYHRDTVDEEWQPLGGPSTRSVLAMPIMGSGATVALLALERPEVDGFSEADRDAVAALARMAETRLRGLAAQADAERRQREWALVARLQTELTTVETLTHAADVAVAILVESLALDGGIVLDLRLDRFRPFARRGEATRTLLRRLETTAPVEHGTLWRAWTGHRACFAEGATEGGGEESGSDLLGTAEVGAALVLPLVDAASRPLAVLVLVSSEARRWSDDERRTVTALTASLGSAFERVRVTQQLHDLLAFSRRLASSTDPRRLYAEVVETAARVIPGADAGSMMLRSERDE